MVARLEKLLQFDSCFVECGIPVSFPEVQCIARLSAAKIAKDILSVMNSKYTMFSATSTAVSGRKQATTC